MISKIHFPMTLVFLMMVSCATWSYEDPHMQQKNIYLQARRHFNDVTIQLNTVIKMQDSENREVLKADFKPYVESLQMALDSWGMVVKQGNLNDTAQREEYQAAKARLLARLTHYLIE